MRLKSGATVLASYTHPAGNNYGWRAVPYATDGSDVDLADLRIEFEMLTAANFCNIYAAHIMAEFEDAA